MNFISRILFSDDFGYYLAYLVSSILALQVTPLFSILHLSFVVRIDLLKNVISAVWLRKSQLFLTFAFLVMVFYYFALIGYKYIADHYPYQRCTRLFDCLVSTFDLTFKDGGGIGVALKDIWKVYTEDSRWLFYTRLAYDVLLAMILVNVMLNIVTGIIIDEFASLKDAMNERLEDTRNTCYICGLDRELFERNNIDFDVHVKKDHYLWNYIYYIAYLNSRNQADLTGTESYIFKHVEDKNINWLPIHKASGIEDEVESQKTRYDMIHQLERVYKSIKDEIEYVIDRTNAYYETILIDDRL